MTTTPPSLASQFSESQNPATQARVSMSMSKTAQDVASENASTPNHAMRVSLATRVANSPQMLVVPFTGMICAQGITSLSSDTDISNMISAVWDTMAGVPAV
jgi:hypothetical protein